MSVVAEVCIPTAEFELGRVLAVRGEVRVTLETMVPLGQEAVPFFTVSDDVRERFEEAVRNHPSVEAVQIVTEHEGETLYGLKWRAERDHVFRGLRELDVQLLEATGGSESWVFELRFETHADLDRFREHCDDANIHLTVERIYNPTKPDSGPWYGLTPKQRETLILAFERGYYSIPRKGSTVDLAATLGISDQAITERLRRGIHNLLENTVMVEAGGVRADGGADDD